MAMTRGEKRNLAKGLLFTSPWILGIVLFLAYPVGASLYYSFTDYNLFLPPIYIGADNYAQLSRDALFWKALYNTFVYALFALPLTVMASIGIAMLLNRPIRLRSVFRTIFFLPSLVPLVALAILWQWIFNGRFGVLNYFLDGILGVVGLSAPNWMGDPMWTKPALIITGLWGVGGSIVIYLAALQEVPAQLYEAAEVDGASAFSKFYNITLPMISPVIYFNVIMGLIGVLQIFAVPFVMFGRGPADSTYFFAMYIYDSAFKYLRMGYASAMAWIMFLIIFGLTLLATHIARKRIYYGAD